MENNILEVKKLSIAFQNEKIINNISFVVKKNDFLTIIGPNGSGKTVLLRILLGLIKKYQGKVSWKKNIKIGYLPQGLTRLALEKLPLTVEDFLRLKKLSRDKIVEVLKSVDVYEKNFLRKKMGNLSGGQFQRVLMAWALANNPDVLLFDEPTTGIDTKGEKTVYSLLNDLRREKKLAIILITHDLNVVYKYSNSVLCMSRDNICHGVPQEISSEMLEKIYQMPIKFYKHHH